MRTWVFGIAVATATIVFPTSRAAAGEEAPWRMGPAASWVAPEPTAAAKAAPGDTSVLETLLDDTQVRVSPGNEERYHHVKVRPLSPSQVEHGSQLELDINPAHERMVLHHAHVVRDGRVVSAIEAPDVRIVQRERDLEQRIYDGTLTAVIFLRDVRVGDVVDYAFTLEGANPLLGGKYVTRFPLADNAYKAAWRHRIILPAGRTLNIKTHGIALEPKVTADGNGREYLWERRDVGPIEPDDQLPAWFDAEPWVDASEFGTWAEVAALYDRLFPSLQRPNPALAAQVAKLRAAAETDEGRLLAATRFVQDDVRYLGLEVGLGGHKPSEPKVVLERRFGDCKDKTVLLVALLGELGFQARPALVNTRRGRGLDAFLPSPFAFNHAIVQVTVGGASHFIDATRTHQRGALASRQPPRFERALLVAPDTQGLVPIPRPPLTEPAMAVKETYTLAAEGPAAELEVETTLRFDDADSMRARLVAQGKIEIAREYLNYYAEDNPTVSPAGDLEAIDDEPRNVLVVRERYHVGEFWRDSQHQLNATALRGHLTPPHIRLRRMPYALEFPLAVSHATIVRLPTPSNIEPDTREIADDYLRFTSLSHDEGNDLVIRYDLRTLADAVPVDQAARFFTSLDEIRQRAGFVLRRPDLGHNRAEVWLRAHTGLIALGVLGAFVALMMVGGARELMRARRQRTYKSQVRFEAGEAATTAIELQSAGEVEARIARLKCACGSRYQPGSGDDDQPVAYYGRTLIVRTAQCSGCRAPRPVFFSIREN